MATTSQVGGRDRSVRLPDDAWERLSRLSVETGLPTSWHIRRAVQLYLARDPFSILQGGGVGGAATPADALGSPTGPGGEITPAARPETRRASSRRTGRSHEAVPPAFGGTPDAPHEVSDSAGPLDADEEAQIERLLPARDALDRALAGIYQPEARLAEAERQGFGTSRPAPKPSARPKR